MPRYVFDLLQDGIRRNLADAELSDREMARRFAIDLAGEVMQGRTDAGQLAASRIIISGADGEELDTIISEGS